MCTLLVGCKWMRAKVVRGASAPRMSASNREARQYQLHQLLLWFFHFTALGIRWGLESESVWEAGTSTRSLRVNRLIWWQSSAVSIASTSDTSTVELSSWAVNEPLEQLVASSDWPPRSQPGGMTCVGDLAEWEQTAPASRPSNGSSDTVSLLLLFVATVSSVINIIARHSSLSRMDRPWRTCSSPSIFYLYDLILGRMLNVEFHLLLIRTTRLWQTDLASAEMLECCKDVEGSRCVLSQKCRVKSQVTLHEQVSAATDGPSDAMRHVHSAVHKGGRSE